MKIDNQNISLCTSWYNKIKMHCELKLTVDYDLNIQRRYQFPVSFFSRNFLHACLGCISSDLVLFQDRVSFDLSCVQLNAVPL